MKMKPISRCSTAAELRSAFELALSRAMELFAPCAEGSHLYVAPDFSQAAAVAPDGSISRFSRDDIVHWLGEYNAFMLKTSAS